MRLRALLPLLSCTPDDPETYNTLISVFATLGINTAEDLVANFTAEEVYQSCPNGLMRRKDFLRLHAEIVSYLVPIPILGSALYSQEQACTSRHASRPAFGIDTLDAAVTLLMQGIIEVAGPEGSGKTVIA